MANNDHEISSGLFEDVQIFTSSGFVPIKDVTEDHIIYRINIMTDRLVPDGELRINKFKTDEGFLAKFTIDEKQEPLTMYGATKLLFINEQKEEIRDTYTESIGTFYPNGKDYALSPRLPSLYSNTGISEYIEEFSTGSGITVSDVRNDFWKHVFAFMVFLKSKRNYRIDNGFNYVISAKTSKNTEFVKKILDINNIKYHLEKFPESKYRGTERAKFGCNQFFFNLEEDITDMFSIANKTKDNRIVCDISSFSSQELIAFYATISHFGSKPITSQNRYLQYVSSQNEDVIRLINYCMICFGFVHYINYRKSKPQSETSVIHFSSMKTLKMLRTATMSEIRSKDLEIYGLNRPSYLLIRFNKYSRPVVAFVETGKKR